MTAHSGKPRRFEAMLGEVRLADIICVALLDQGFSNYGSRPQAGSRNIILGQRNKLA